MTATTKTRFTGIIALGLIAAALIPAAPALAGSGGGIAQANNASDNGSGVFTAKLRRDPAAADPFFVQSTPSAQATDSSDLSTGGVIVLISGLALAVTAIVMTASASTGRRRTAPAQPGRAAPIA